MNKPDPARRLIIELPVEGNAANVAVLEKIAGCARIPLNSLVLPPKSHVTLLFAGRPNELWDEVGTGLVKDRTRFLTELEVLVGQLLAQKAVGRVRVSGIAPLVNGGRTYTVATLEQSPALSRLRMLAWNGLVEGLEAADVPDAETALRNSRALALPADDWLPHVTLEKDCKQPGQRAVLMSETTLQLGAPRLHA